MSGIQTVFSITEASKADTEALRLVEGSPEIQRSIVQSVAQKCREWLSDPMNMGLALASGKLQDGQLVLSSLIARVHVDSSSCSHARVTLSAWRFDCNTKRPRLASAGKRPPS